MLTERRKFALEAKEIATISANLVESLGDLIDVVTEIAERRKLNS
jgi:hypothetical protein